jgi:hypothetical protein
VAADGGRGGKCERQPEPESCGNGFHRVLHGYRAICD